MFYLFSLQRMDKTTRVDTRSGNFICFIDHHKTNDIDGFIERLHEAYKRGIYDGKKEKAEEIKTKLGI